jgi:SSS family solute:Na+ symporter
MISLSPLDYGVIGAFLLVILGLGFTVARFASKNMESYFLGGRNMPWWLLGVSGMSGWFDLTGTMIITSFLFMLGPRGLFIEFRGGAALGLAFLMAYTGKWHRRSGCMTGAEWATYRFGTGTSGETLRAVNALMGIVLSIAYLAYLVRGATLFMGVVFPFDPVLVTVGILGFATLFTMATGFYGMVIADLFQGTIMILGCFIISVIAWHQVPNAASLAAVAFHVTGNAHWVFSHPSWHVNMPPGYEAYNDLIMAAGFYLLRNVLGGMGSGADLRFFAARNPREASLQCLMQGLTVMFRWPLMISCAIMGLILVSRILPQHEAGMQAAAILHADAPGITPGAWHGYVSGLVHHPESAPPGALDKIQALLGPNWKGALLLISYRGTVDPEMVLPSVVLEGLGSGLRGLLVVCLLAALMGSLSSFVTMGSAFFVRDIYQNFIRRQAGNRELIFAAYAASALIVLFSFVMGLTAPSINNIWGWLTMSLTAGAVGPQVLRLYWWRVNGWGMVLGTFMGGIAAVIQRALDPGMSEWVQFVVMIVISFAATVLGSLCTSPTPHKIVHHFYHTTRPFGIWGRYWQELPDQVQAQWRVEHRSDILSTLSILVWQVCLFMLPMQFLTRNWVGFSCTLPLFLAGSVALYAFWWRHLPPASDADGEPRAVSVAKLQH